MNVAPLMGAWVWTKPIVLMRHRKEAEVQKFSKLIKADYTKSTKNYRFCISNYRHRILSPNNSIRNLCVTAHAQVHLVTDWSLSWKCLLSRADTPPNLPHFTINFSEHSLGSPTDLPRTMINFSSIPGQFHQVAISWSISSGGTFEITSTSTPIGEVELPDRTLYKQWGWGVKYHRIWAVSTGTLLTLPTLTKSLFHYSARCRYLPACIVL